MTRKHKKGGGQEKESRFGHLAKPLSEQEAANVLDIIAKLEAEQQGKPEGERK